MAAFRVAAFAAMTSLACLPSMAEASACWYPDEARAAQVRGLQTMLMVGTLQCRHRSRDAEELYTDFIVNQRGTLDANNAVLKARFEREAGIASGQGAYDRFGTALANRYSEELDNPAFCATVQRLAWEAAYVDRAELLRIADAVAAPPATGQCRPARYAEAGTSAALPPPRVAVADPAELAAPAPVEVATVAPTAEPAKLERVLEAASAVSAAAAPTPSEAKMQPAAQIAASAAANRDEALKAALIALESALTALQAASVSAPAVAEPAGAATLDAAAADPGSVVQVDVPASR